MTRLLTATLLLTLGLCPPAWSEFTLRATGRLSQFDDSETLTFAGESGAAPALQVDDAFVLGARRGYLARASASALASGAVATDSGVARPDSLASLQGATIVFEDSPELRALIAPGEDELVLHLRFDLAALALVPNDPDPSRQASTVLNLSAGASTLAGASSATGRLQVVNGPFDFELTATGVMAGFGAGGGATTFDLPITLRPDRNGGLVATFQASISAASLSLEPDVFGLGLLGLPADVASTVALNAPGGSTLRVASGPDQVVLPDGRSARSLGVRFQVIPTVVPEPASAWALALGLLACAGRRAIRRGGPLVG